MTPTAWTGHSASQSGGEQLSLALSDAGPWTGGQERYRPQGVGDVSMGASRRANRTPDPSKCQPMAMLATLDFIGVRLLATRM